MIISNSITGEKPTSSHQKPPTAKDNGFMVKDLELPKLKVDNKRLRFLLWRPKVKNESIIYMKSLVKNVLQRRYEGRSSDYVFTNEKGDGPRNHATTAIKKSLKRARDIMEGLVNRT